MGVYERLGVHPIIQVAGAPTRWSGTLMDQETIEDIE